MTKLADRPCSPLQLARAARHIKLFANPARLLVLAQLASADEICVSALHMKIGIAPSALSQQLAKLREEQLICFRRDHSTLFYRLDPRNERTLRALLSVIAKYLDQFEP